MTTPASARTAVSLGSPYDAQENAFPFATTGPAYDTLPSFAFHRRFRSLSSSTLKSNTRFRSRTLTRFRLGGTALEGSVCARADATRAHAPARAINRPRKPARPTSTDGSL